MSPRNWKIRIDDICEAIARIEDYTVNLSYNEWQNDRKTIDAVIRNLEIIGEATAHLPADFKKIHPEIPWNKIQGIRNILIHEYFGVDTDVLWKTVKKICPP